MTREINAFTAQPNQMERITSQLRQRIQDVFSAAEVEIMSPTYLSLRDGNAGGQTG